MVIDYAAAALERAPSYTIHYETTATTTETTRPSFFLPSLREARFPLLTDSIRLDLRGKTSSSAAVSSTCALLPLLSLSFLESYARLDDFVFALTMPAS